MKNSTALKYEPYSDDIEEFVAQVFEKAFLNKASFEKPKKEEPSLSPCEIHKCAHARACKKYKTACEAFACFVFFNITPKPTEMVIREHLTAWDGVPPLEDVGAVVCTRELYDQIFDETGYWKARKVFDYDKNRAARVPPFGGQHAK